MEKYIVTKKQYDTLFEMLRLSSYIYLNTEDERHIMHPCVNCSDSTIIGDRVFCTCHMFYDWLKSDSVHNDNKDAVQDILDVADSKSILGSHISTWMCYVKRNAHSDEYVNYCKKRLYTAECESHRLSHTRGHEYDDYVKLDPTK